MSDKKIVRLDIVDTNPEKSEDRILETYYLVNPDKNKLNALKKGVENRFKISNGCFEGLWEIEDFIKRHFETINIERKEIKW